MSTYVCYKCERTSENSGGCPECGTHMVIATEYFKETRRCVCHACKLVFVAKRITAGCPKCNGPIQLEGFYRRTQPEGVFNTLQECDKIAKTMATEPENIGTKPFDGVSKNVAVSANRIGAANAQYQGRYYER